MKYIDADKLIAEIERRIDSWSIRGKNSPVGQGKDTCESRVTELSDLLSFINSLQQERPNAPKSKFNFPKFLYARTLDNKTIDISYAPQNMDAIEYVRNDLVEQEQPEVDLEKYISDKLFVLGADLINHKPYSFNRGLNVGMSKAYADILTILNARKEEIKP